MTRDMTRGNPLSLIVQFSLPLLAGNLFQQMYNMVDAAIVGRVLGSGALAAVGASSSVQFLVLGFCFGTCGGFAIPVAQRFGAGDYDAMRSFIFWAGVLTVVMSVAITVPCAVCCRGILRLLQTPDDIFADAYAYLLIVFMGIPFMLLYNLLSGILRAVGDSKTPFVFLVISTVLNVAGDLFCIIVLGWGCAGAAIATVIAQAISGVLCFAYIRLKVAVLHVRRADMRFEGRRIAFLLGMGVPMGLQFSITAIGSMVMQRANNGLGSVYVSAFTASLRIKQLAMSPFDALATAVSTFSSQNYGAGNVARIKEGIRKGTVIGITYGLAVGLVLVLCGRALSGMFVSRDEVAVLDAAKVYLRSAGFFYWSLGILNVTRMTTQGLGFSDRAIFSGVTEMIARIAVGTLLVPRFGFVAVCYADPAAWISACLYIVPTCLLCVRKIESTLRASHPKNS